MSVCSLCIAYVSHFRLVVTTSFMPFANHQTTGTYRIFNLYIIIHYYTTLYMCHTGKQSQVGEEVDDGEQQ